MTKKAGKKWRRTRKRRGGKRRQRPGKKIRKRRGKKRRKKAGKIRKKGEKEENEKKWKRCMNILCVQNIFVADNYYLFFILSVY